MEGACTKRKPSAQLTKDNVEGEKPLSETVPGTDAAADLKEADAETLKNRRRLKIVRSHPPPATPPAELQAAKDKPEATKPEAPAAVFERQEAPVAASTEAAEAQNPITERDRAADSATVPAAAAADTAPSNGNTEAGSSNNGSSSTSSSASGGGLFGSFLKGAPAFVSPFGSLGASGSSFLLPPGGTPGATSIFGGPPGAQSEAPAADAEEDVPPPEEPTVVRSSIDSKEEIIFSDRDCRMQCFDVEKRAWAPKPPLDGKLDFVVPKKGEEEGLPVARILFFVNRTGRLPLNTPVLPSSVKFRHPVERTAVSAAAKTPAADAAAAAPEGEAAAKEKKDLPLKMNTVEFTGLKIDAKDSKDTTFYRVRFSSNERAAEFISLANAKQDEATRTPQNGSNK